LGGAFDGAVGVINLLVAAVAFQIAVNAQDFTQRGYVETRISLFPQTAPNDSGRAIAESILRYEAGYKILPGLRLNGVFDARTDTHHQVERSARLDWQDRSTRRPAFSLRRLSVTYNRGKLTAEAGKQFIRWGKADILNPTDRFAPRDFLSVLDTDFLGVLATRVTYEMGSNTIDFVWSPRFTPSRTPLFNQRWVITPPEARNIPFVDRGARFPGGSQFGARFNRLAKGFEYSLCFYEGFNHLPVLDAAVRLNPYRVEIQRVYPKLRLYGADAAVPLRWFTVKGEAAWFTSSSPLADEFVLYVLQLERQLGELSLVGGYAGEAVTDRRNPLFFSPDRGIAKTFLGRAGYTIDARRSVAIETAVRQNGNGAYVKAEYSHLLGQHWRASAGLVLLRGEAGDFLGQYRRNSHALLSLRYSF
jgi:hypothetical protein